MCIGMVCYKAILQYFEKLIASFFRIDIFEKKKKKVQVCGIIGISWEIILTIHFIVEAEISSKKSR